MHIEKQSAYEGNEGDCWKPPTISVKQQVKLVHSGLASRIKESKTGLNIDQ